MTTVLKASSSNTKPRIISGWWNVCLIMFAVAWGGNQFTPLLFMYRTESSFSEVTVNALLFAYVVGLIPSLLLAAGAARRVGTKRIFAAAVSMSILGSILLLVGSTVPVIMFLGRGLIGLALGIGMVVGGLYFKSLSTTSITHLDNNGGAVLVPSPARSSAMALTAGFGLGAGVAGVVAQWLPYPTVLPYFFHLAVCIPAGVGVFRLPMTNVGKEESRPDSQGLKFSRDFFLKVLPAAPWIFGALGIAYAILPSIVSSHLEGFATAFSALLCILSLGMGFIAQQIVGYLPTRWRMRTRPLGIILFIIGTCVAVTVASNQFIGLVILTSVILGLGYGLILVGCLQDCDRLARPGQLGTMTGIVYTLGYLGFGLPMAVAWLHENLDVSYPLMLIWIASIAFLLNLAGVTIASLLRRYQRINSSN